MYARHDDAGRIDTDHYERSPSTGGEETTRILGARDGYDHEPPSDDGDPVRVLDLGSAAVLREGVRCDHHAKEFVEVTS